MIVLGRRLRHAEANDSIQRWAKEKEDRYWRKNNMQFINHCLDGMRTSRLILEDMLNEMICLLVYVL